MTLFGLLNERTKPSSLYVTKKEAVGSLTRTESLPGFHQNQSELISVAKEALFLRHEQL